jgi:hypothetical protein
MAVHVHAISIEAHPEPHAMDLILADGQKCVSHVSVFEKIFLVVHHLQQEPNQQLVLEPRSQYEEVIYHRRYILLFHQVVFCLLNGELVHQQE